MIRLKKKIDELKDSQEENRKKELQIREIVLKCLTEKWESMGFEKILIKLYLTVFKFGLVEQFKDLEVIYRSKKH